MWQMSMDKWVETATVPEMCSLMRAMADELMLRGRQRASTELLAIAVWEERWRPTTPNSPLATPLYGNG
jgi:hypothetical protein